MSRIRLAASRTLAWLRASRSRFLLLPAAACLAAGLWPVLGPGAGRQPAGPAQADGLAAGLWGQDGTDIGTGPGQEEEGPFGLELADLDQAELALADLGPAGPGVAIPGQSGTARDAHGAVPGPEDAPGPPAAQEEPAQPEKGDPVEETLGPAGQPEKSAPPAEGAPSGPAPLAGTGLPGETWPDEGDPQGAYERSLAILLPASPEEVRSYRQSQDERAEALADPPPAAMRSRTERVWLEPGASPPLVELSPNLVTALVFTDSTGQPWPVAATVLGSGALFSAQLLEGEPANQVIVSPLAGHGHSNLVVGLKGKDVPLVARLSTSPAARPGRRLDGLVVFQVQEPGPLALPGAPEAPGAGSVVGDVLYGLLDGLEPEGARPVEAEPALEGETFLRSGDSLYLRTRRRLMWPAHTAMVSGPGGVAVYELPPVPSVLVRDSRGVSAVTLGDGR